MRLVIYYLTWYKVYKSKNKIKYYFIYNAIIVQDEMKRICFQLVIDYTKRLSVHK